MALALNNLEKVDMPLNERNQTKPNLPLVLPPTYNINVYDSFFAFVIWLLSTKMAPVGTESTWEIYNTFLNSFHLKVKWHKVSVLFNQTCLTVKMLPRYTKIYTNIQNEEETFWLSFCTNALGKGTNLSVLPLTMS